MKKSVPKETVIQRSANIFVENGVRTTVDELSHRLRISKRTIYEQFEDKTDLMRECVVYLVNELPELPVIHRNITNQIPNICQILFEILMPVFGKKSIFIRDLKTYYPELYDEYLYPVIQKTEKSLLDNIKKSAKDGFIRSDVAFDMYVSYLLHFTFMVTCQSDAQFDKYSRNNIFQNTIFPYLRGLFTEKGIIEFDEQIKNYMK